jgi:hypothetical protein
MGGTGSGDRLARGCASATFPSAGGKLTDEQWAALWAPDPDAEDPEKIKRIKADKWGTTREENNGGNANPEAPGDAGVSLGENKPDA